ncbi:hypothetical protein BIW11_09621 [Tropilaelaps mercedesae]|uniref:Uncharacterized protein n=1 Tax=Tropilaelaps mercedesae TaxID=418985 RepID=A0A1V9XJT2_9ACAR|nr:hypothetical protein BIW11_09621 [Tropilaelaps mercedesae]
MFVLFQVSVRFVKGFETAAMDTAVEDALFDGTQMVCVLNRSHQEAAGGGLTLAVLNGGAIEAYSVALSESAPFIASCFEQMVRAELSFEVERLARHVGKSAHVSVRFYDALIARLYHQRDLLMLESGRREKYIAAKSPIGRQKDPVKVAQPRIFTERTVLPAVTQISSPDGTPVFDRYNDNTAANGIEILGDPGKAPAAPLFPSLPPDPRPKFSSQTAPPTVVLHPRSPLNPLPSPVSTTKCLRNPLQPQLRAPELLRNLHHHLQHLRR